MNHFYFRMNMPKQLEVSCDFDGFLVCKLPKDIVEVELKIKTKWGKYTLLKDFHSRTEKYRLWERADTLIRIYSQRRMPHQVRAKDPHDSVCNTTSTDSGTYIPTGYGKGYPPKIFTNPNYLQDGSNTNSDSEVEPLALASKPPSDWDEDLIDLIQNDNASHQNTNPYDVSDEENLGGIAKAQPQATPRQPSPGWASWRKEASLPVINKDKPQENNAATSAVSNNKGMDKLTIEDARTIVEEEFHSID